MFIFTPKFGEMMLFDVRIFFQMGWFNHQLGNHYPAHPLNRGHPGKTLQNSVVDSVGFGDFPPKPWKIRSSDVFRWVGMSWIGNDEAGNWQDYFETFHIISQGVHVPPLFGGGGNMSSLGALKLWVASPVFVMFKGDIFQNRVATFGIFSKVFSVLCSFHCFFNLVFDCCFCGGVLGWNRRVENVKGQMYLREVRRSGKKHSRNKTTN